MHYLFIDHHSFQIFIHNLQVNDVLFILEEMEDLRQLEIVHLK